MTIYENDDFLSIKKKEEEKITRKIMMIKALVYVNQKLKNLKTFFFHFKLKTIIFITVNKTKIGIPKR